MGSIAKCLYLGGLSILKNLANISFSGERFWTHFLAFSNIGALSQGGVERPFGSKEDLEARLYLQNACRAIGLEVQVDPIGNLWAVLPGTEKLSMIAVGSHHDSVPQGGRFDGALGVLTSLETLHALKEGGYKNRHPLALVSFTAEEPNPFNLSTMGSRTVAGRLTKDSLIRSRDWNGRPLQEAILAVGGNLELVEQARKTSNDLGAFLELHIEQGKRLERAQKPLAIVTGICGIHRLDVTVIGEANHAGTTMLADRHDAFLAASEIALAFEKSLLDEHRDDLVGTIGRFEIFPNAANIIPGSARFIVEIRASTVELMHRIASLFQKKAQAIAKRRGVQFNADVILDQAPEEMDKFLIAALEDVSTKLQIPYDRLFSMAGHDATHMASFTKAGMLFVPSIDGKSHCQDEESRFEDIVLAGQVMVDAIIQMDQTLDNNS